MKLSKLGAGLLFFVIIFIGVLLLMRYGPKVIKPGPCGEPPQAIVTSNINIDAVLAESTAAMKGDFNSKVIDLIPKSVRTAEAVNYLTCIAKDRGLIKSPDEIKRHKELLGFIMTNPSPKEYADFIKTQSEKKDDPVPFKHEGIFKSLRLHFEKRVPREQFELIVPQPPSEQLDRFWIGEINESSWPNFFSKLCKRHMACLVCDPSPDEITTKVKIQISGKLIEDVTREGTKIYKCAGERTD